MKSIHAFLFLFVGCAVFVGLLFYHYSLPQASSFIKGRFITMSTLAQYEFHGEDKDTAVQMMKQAFIDCEQHCNIFNPTSEVSRLNTSAYHAPFICSNYLFDLILKSKKYYDLSEGAFDITSRPLMQLWGFHRKQPRPELPSQAEKENALKCVGFNKLKLNQNKNEITFLINGMSLDFGGIAKGYAVDCAMDSILTLHIDTAIVDLGGNIRCFNRAQTKIEIPINTYSQQLDEMSVSLQNNSVATSGNYYRFVVIDGKKYTHIMNPRTGEVISDVQSVVVVAPKAIDADAASTAIFVGGKQVMNRLLDAKLIDSAYLK